MPAASVRGSGPNGRIIEADVQPAVRSRPAGAAPAVGTVSIMRRAIAQRTAESFATAPHFYLRAEVDANALVQLREHLLAPIEGEVGVRLTLTDLLLRALALALGESPQANCIWSDNTLVTLPTRDVGVVVGLPDGLLIPVIRHADQLTLSALAKRRAELVAAARAGQLPSQALEGGATSLSNLGNTRVDEFASVLPPSHSSILAVGRAALRPYVVHGQLAVRTTLKLCLSVDHRVLDGGPAAEFLGRIVDLIERPQLLVTR